MRKPTGHVKDNQERKPKKLLDLAREILRRKHYSIRTEETYVGWITRYMYFHNKRHPKDMGVPEIEEFLTHLAVDRNVSPSTQNQAFNALLFLYRNVLNISLEGQEIDAVRARKKRNLPVVMTKDEVKKIIMAMSGVNQLMAKLIYGSGKNRFWKLFSQTWRLLLKVTFATLGIILTTKNINHIKVTIQRYPMGEIKSTLDLVMEKTRHLTLSQEEKEEQKHIEVNKRLKGLLQKYQDNLLKKEHLEKELDSLRKAYDLKVDKMLSRMLLDSLKIGHKNESLLELLNEICGLDVSGLEALFHDFQDAVGFASEKRIKEIKADLAEKCFISGSAVVPNPEADNELILTVEEIKDKFDQILVREKTALYDRAS